MLRAHNWDSTQSINPFVKMDYNATPLETMKAFLEEENVCGLCYVATPLKDTSMSKKSLSQAHRKMWLTVKEVPGEPGKSLFCLWLDPFFLDESFW